MSDGQGCYQLARNPRKIPTFIYQPPKERVVATVSGEDVVHGQVDRSDQAWQRFITGVDLGARWAALILFVVLIVAQTVMYLGR